MKLKVHPVRNSRTGAFAIGLLVVVLFCLAGIARGQTNGDYRSRATGNWTTTATWSVYNNGWVNATNYPGQAAGAGNVLIQDGHTVSINITVPNAIGSLTVGGGTSGILEFYNSASAGNYTLNVSGAVIVNSGASFLVTNRSNYNDHTLNIGGNLTVNGTFDMTSTTDDKADVVLNGSVQQIISGTGATCSFYDLTISNTNGVVLSRNIELSPSPSYFTSPSLTISSNCTFDLSTYTCNRSTSGAGTVTLASGATLRIGGTNTFPSNYNIHSINASSTVEYYGSNQAVAALNSSQNYGNLVLSGSGTKTFGGARAITNNLSISGTAKASLADGTTSSAGTLTLGGSGTPGGSWGSTSSSATYKNDTYFLTGYTGIINVGSGSCPTISATASGQGNVSCYAGADGTITVNTSGGLPPYQYSIYNGATGTYQSSNYFSGLTAGPYYLRVIDANGCESPSCP